MKKLSILVLSLLALVSVRADGQVSGIAGYLLVGRSTVAAMPAANTVVRGLWIVTDASTTSTCATGGGANVVVCVDQGSTWAALTGGGGGSGAPDAHATTHQDGGSDEISVAGLTGLLATAQTPAAHSQAASTISDSTVAGRSLLTAADALAQRTALGLGTSAVLNVPAAGNAAVGEVVKGDDTRLTDARTPTSHATSHENGGADEVSVAGLSGVLADPQTPATHSHTAAGDVDGDLAALDLDEAAVEAELEAVLDLADLQGAVTDAQVPDTITASNYAPLVGATFIGPVAIDNAQTFKLFEADANGSNFFALVAPASLTGDVTCTIGADGQIPDSCVGDGVDGGGGVTDHGALTGLADDDHTQYLLADGTRATTGNFTIGSGLELRLPLENVAATPTLSFGDGDSGVYQPADNQLGFATGASLRWSLVGGAWTANDTTGPEISNLSATATNPPYRPSKTDTNTGYSWASADDARVIANAVSRLAANGNANNEGVGFLNGNFTADSDARSRMLTARNSTTTATPAELFLNGSSTRMVLDNDTTWAFSCLVTARRTDADGEGAGYKLEGVIDRQTNAASTALIGSVTTTTLAEDNAAWDVAATADTTNGALVLTVTGEASKTIRWVSSCHTSESKG